MEILTILGGGYDHNDGHQSGANLPPGDYMSETSEVSELTDIMEESGEFSAVSGGLARPSHPGGLPSGQQQSAFSLESVGVPSVMPTVYDYQQYLKTVRTL